MGQTLFLRWSESEQAAAQTYADATNTYSQTHWSEQFCAEWYPRLDRDQKRGVPFFDLHAVGAIVEPEGFADLRVGTETVEMVYWPEDE